MANNVDPDQMSHSAVSDLGLHCLQMPVCPNTLGYYNKVFLRLNMLGNFSTQHSEIFSSYFSL